MMQYSKRQYHDPRAQEYVRHGFLRRVTTMARCIHNIFEILPPDRVERPDNAQRSDASINIQAFVFNAFGCTDNLAWVWVQERKITRPDGSPIPDNWIGLRQSNKLVRRSFSTEFQVYLNGLNDWFTHLENFRHSLAHRIPLYIPPYSVTANKKAAYQELGTQATKAFERCDFVEYDRLLAEQEALGEFRPVMTHSFEENAPVVVFHGQLLSDFLTIDELGQKMLEELNR